MIIELIAVAAMVAAAFTIGYRIARRQYMATPDQLKETFHRVMAATKAAQDRDKAAAVEIAIANVKDEVRREYDAVDAAMMDAAPKDFSPSGN